MANIITNYESMAYDHPAYVNRTHVEFPVTTAGASAVTQKYVAFANFNAYGISMYSVAPGTSTYTFTANGTQTIAIAATQFSLITIVNTAAYGTTVGLSTSTYGPFTAAGSFVVNGTATNQAGQFTQYALNTASSGGVSIPVGAEYYFVGGTDTTGTEVITMDLEIVPLQSVIK